jgi:hypothetical protein
MSDNVNPVEEAREARLASIPVTENIEGEAPAKEPSSGGPPEMVPYERVQQQARKIKDLETRERELAEQAKNWQMLVQDPQAVEILSGYYRGAVQPAGSHPSTASAGDDELVDPHVKQLETKLEMMQRQFMGVLAPMVQAQAEQQRRAIKDIHPEYEPQRDDAMINTLMAQGRARSPLDAYRILRSERAATEAPKTDRSQSGTVMSPSGVRAKAETLLKQVEKAKEKYLQTREETDLEAWLAAKGRASGLTAYTLSQFGQ